MRGELMRKEEGFVVGSGNVFADLGFENPEEALAKAQLIHQISRIITANGWTQEQAANKLGIDQPKVSALVRGRLTGFSIERLSRFLNTLDYDVTISVSPKAPGRPHGHTTVTETNVTSEAGSCAFAPSGEAVAAAER